MIYFKGAINLWLIAPLLFYFYFRRQNLLYIFIISARFIFINRSFIVVSLLCTLAVY